MAAVALLMTACNNDDNISNDQPAEARGIPFTATISTGGSPTRALSGPDGSDVISATWATGDHVALVYKVGDATKVTDATVKAVDNGSGQKMATLTAMLDENVTTGTDVTLIYPYSAVDLTTGANYGKVKTDVFAHQLGTIADISTNCDLRQGTGKLTLATGSATLKENVTMDSQIAIWNLSLQSGGSALSATKLNAYFGGMTASATVTGGTNEYYMAVPAGKTGLTFIATAADGSYIYNSTASVTLAASTYYQSTVTLTKQTTKTIASDAGEVTLNDGDIVTGTGGANTQLKIANGATVTLAGLTNNSMSGNHERAAIECLGNATIILEGTNTLKGLWEMSAIYIPSGNTLTIRGGGTLIADNSGAYGAGIGGSFQNDCGNIVIEGGNITAKGSTGAGIGGGSNGHSCGTITISGGTITATGGDNAAGIGSGQNGSCGAITISGGTINATGGDFAAGIGSGYAYGNPNTCGDITISGSAQVTATGGNRAAGIGSGNADNAKNTCGNITISGGTVKAVGKTCAAGIGTGSGYEDNNGVCGAITISGGIVEATGGDDAAGIGSGCHGKFTSISITSGITSVTATRSNDFCNAPIGKGEGDQGSGAVTFGGVVMHNGTGDSRQSDWTNWPEDGGPFGGIRVSASDYGSNNGRTWTLTPAP